MQAKAETPILCYSGRRTAAFLPDIPENFRTYVCFSLTDSLWVKRTEIPLELEEKYIEVTIDRSLWQDLKDAGFNPLVANGLSEVFAWTTDFFGLQKGDVFRACYQAYLLQGEEVDAGHILTASFSRGGTNQLAFRYVRDSVAGYWDQDGVNLQGLFESTIKIFQD